MNRTIIDIHALQTVPPSNVNRDDTGSPKTALYGGTTRARVSSQAWKRATRKAFEGLLQPHELGIRTKRVVDLIAEAITEAAPDLGETSVKLAEGVVKAAGITVEKPKARPKKDADAEVEVEENPQVAYLLFLSRRQIANLADMAIHAERTGEPLDKTTVRKAADSEHSVDLALFGRMVADAADLNVDAAAQVAHAISVHAVDNDYDYFTAVDDRAPEDNAGAGMIGTVEFNSSTLYRYATVDANALNANLGTAESTAHAVAAFIRAFVTSMPTGKQNTFANRTLPDAVVVSVRDTQPVNLVGAFGDAVVASDGSARLEQASERLADYSAEIDKAYAQKAVASFVLRVGKQTQPLEALGKSVDIDTLVSSVEGLVADRLGSPA
ncbi:MAG TPA: type I-E CRISPR-associated protein Cas7/Cse4/CasC [Terrimesophilobacter sp.]|nr:type I-E CRISPR-associated protein Cas7/Cse4/CasC [Terrimesophilobacter sp.]HRP99723.1 type I-E CRISPR-associated protein Cas7/Cse4/CasC [Terrimesophilobacter sp.]